MKTQRVRLFLFVVYFFILSSQLFGIELNFKYYMVENGLSSNTVYTIIQDSKGYIWIGTEDGLNRFDGYSFRSFRNTPRDSTSIINNYIYALYEDINGQLWVGTETGISIYDSRNNQFHYFNKKTKNNILLNDKIQNIIADENENMWISSFRQGVFFYDKELDLLKMHSFEKYIDNRQEPIYTTCIYKDRNGTIWALANNTRYQLYKYNKQTDDFVPAFPEVSSEMLKKLGGYSMLEDTFGTLWIGTWTNGLLEVDKKEGVKRSYLNTENVDKILHIHSMMEYEPGMLLIGSNDGLTSFNVSSVIGNRRDAHIKEPLLSNRFVYPIFKDREGGLWIGTYYGGINYASPNRNYFTSYTHNKHENSISGNVVSTFCEDKSGNLWIGTDEGGLNFFNTKTEQFTVYKPDKTKNSLSFHNVHALCIDGNELWIGTYTGGLNVMDLTTKRFRYYYNNPSDETTLDANNIYALYKDSYENIWIGTTTGINIYDRKTDSFRRLKKLNTLVIDILQVGNRVWFATIGDGLHSYNLDTEEWDVYRFDPNNNSSLISNDVICLCLDDTNHFWIGTNSGLCSFDFNSKSFIQNSVDFQSNAISSIFSDNGILWIATTKGLVSFDPQKNKYRTFTKDDGLLSNQFTGKSGLKTSSGKIYLGTANGFNAFYPKQIIINRHIPQIEITDFQLFNKSVNIHDYMSYNNDSILQVTLPYNKNGFSFEYTALSYFAPEKNEYAFILEGFDKHWNYVGKERKAAYTNIPPGEYYFKVRASNNDGIWNTDGLTIKLVVTPPFWWNKWSISFYIILIIGVLIALLYYMRKRDEKRNKERIEKIKNEQEKEAYDSKINFFTTIAHEIRTPVSLIIGPLEQIIKTARSLPEEIKGDLNIIDRNSQRLLNLVNQLLDFRKIEKEAIQISLFNQNVHEFLQNMYDRFKPFMDHKQINFVYTYDSVDFCTGIDVENLTKVVSNLLNNASKYTKDSVELILRTKIDRGLYEICVKDNGPGISESEQERIFKPFYQISGVHKSGTGLGLYLVKSIIDANDGKIKIDSEPEKGLSFSVFLPVIRQCPIQVAPIEIDETEQDLMTSFDVDNEELFIDEDKQVVLIVEDNADMREFIAKNLKLSYTILLAKDGQEGICLLEKEEVDLVISDIMMPNMNGIEFCNAIKKNILWSHIPIIMLTAKTNITSKIEALEIGADAYIEKPFSIDYLFAQIKNLLKSREVLMKKFAEAPFSSLKSIAGNSADAEFLAKVNDVIENNLSNVDFTIEQLADELHISSSGLFAKIKNVSAVTPNKLLLLMRLKKAAELLYENKYRVNEVCYMVGFNNPSYFAKCFQKQYGVLPSDFIEKKKASQ
ncbi:response regulator [Dysgonomonas sp. Marseille-P4677]|uniref:hybrid sensor histidine kinase/response regulator transcription factor n=1 Tax=Dysgonomonas sp. Marseille-P4677 TaxID=2364790 RepID=UPI001914AE5C|nr:two-component regulator propeller domain-containing protein [Dysgonomonas sp. Marseille-P4677]MBK5720112.1 response regulator [Dysgonomonas sp. Marseille-P4677]